MMSEWRRRAGLDDRPNGSSSGGRAPTCAGTTLKGNAAARQPRHLVYRAVADRFIAPLPQPADATEHLVSHWPGCRMIECLGVVQFQHQAGIWKHRDADVMEGHVAASGHTVRIDPEQACGLQVLAGKAIERDSLPLAAENRPHLEVIGDLAGVAPHVLCRHYWRHRR